MKIISWNVNGVRSWYKKGSMDWVLSQNPDIFCTQEMKAYEDQLPEGLKNLAGYTMYMEHSKHKKGYSGVAIYIKNSIQVDKVDTELRVHNPSTLKTVAKTSISIDPNGIDHEGRFIAIYIKNLVLINCYFPNGGGDEERLQYKLNFYKSFKEYIEKAKKDGKDVIFCGDVNVAHTEIDIARPKENANRVGFLPVERAWVDSVIDAGFIDVYRNFNPDVLNVYTWWDLKSFARDRNIGWRIDYFFVNKEILKNVTSVTNYADIFGSDHCPISMEIEIK